VKPKVESEVERRQRMAKLLTDPKTKRGRMIRAYFEVLEASGEPVPSLRERGDVIS